MSKKIVCLLMLTGMMSVASVYNTTMASANNTTMASANNTTLASASESGLTENTPTTEFDDVTITCYNAVAGQCSGNPLITASGRKIDLKKLNRGELRYCAVSRDLLEEYSYGDTIEVFICEGHPYNGEWLVADTMHKRWNKRIDLLLSTKQKAGKWEGRITTQASL